MFVFLGRCTLNNAKVDFLNSFLYLCFFNAVEEVPNLFAKPKIQRKKYFGAGIPNSKCEVHERKICVLLHSFHKTKH